MRPIPKVIPVLLLLALAFPVQAKIHRDHRAVAEFKRQQPCPSTVKVRGRCPGWVVDHIRPLACAKSQEELNQLDRPENMQWQTIAEAKAKDKWERKECGK